MNSELRVAQIQQTLEAIQNGWPSVYGELNSRISELTASLVHRNDDEVRGKIKALMSLAAWPQEMAEEMAQLVQPAQEEDF